MNISISNCSDCYYSPPAAKENRREFLILLLSETHQLRNCSLSANLSKGSFTYDVITLGGGGGFQMMTIDDEGEGGGFGQ